MCRCLKVSSQIFSLAPRGQIPTTALWRKPWMTTVGNVIFRPQTGSWRKLSRSVFVVDVILSISTSSRTLISLERKSRGGVRETKKIYKTLPFVCFTVLMLLNLKECSRQIVHAPVYGIGEFFFTENRLQKLFFLPGKLFSCVAV